MALTTRVYQVPPGLCKQACNPCSGASGLHDSKNQPLSATWQCCQTETAIIWLQTMEGFQTFKTHYFVIHITSTFSFPLFFGFTSKCFKKHKNIISDISAFNHLVSLVSQPKCPTSMADSIRCPNSFMILRKTHKQITHDS